MLFQYEDNTPADYEPEYFKSSEGQLLGSEMLPLKINVGNLKTPAVDLKVKFAGLESLLFEDLCKVGADTPAIPLSERQAQPAMFSAAVHDDSIVGGVEPEEELAQTMQNMQVEFNTVDSVVGLEDTPPLNRVSRPSSPAQITQDTAIDFETIKNFV